MAVSICNVGGRYKKLIQWHNYQDELENLKNES